MATLKRYIQTETTSYAQECEAILYTGDNIAELCKAFPGMTITLVYGEPTAPNNGIRVGSAEVLVTPGDHIAKLVGLWDNDVWYRSPLTGDFDKYYKEIEADDSPKLKRYIQTEHSFLQAQCKAILYNGENIEQIRKVFPSAIVKSLNGGATITVLPARHSESGGQTVAAWVRPGDYVVKAWGKELGKYGFISPYPPNFDEYYKEIAKLTPNEITGKSAEMIIIDDAIGLHDKITAFARKHDIDGELCKRVIKKCKPHYAPCDDAYTLELLAEGALCGKTINAELFIKLNFLFDQWVENHGDSVMSIIENLNLLKEMTFIEDSTLRGYFRVGVLLQEDAICYIPDAVVNHWCRDNGVYQTDYGVIKFKGEI